MNSRYHPDYRLRDLSSACNAGLRPARRGEARKRLPEARMGSRSERSLSEMRGKPALFVKAYVILSQDVRLSSAFAPFSHEGKRGRRTWQTHGKAHHSAAGIRNRLPLLIEERFRPEQNGFIPRRQQLQLVADGEFIALGPPSRPPRRRTWSRDSIAPARRNRSPWYRGGG